MSDTPRTVTGVFRSPSGQVFPNKTVTFYRDPRAAAAQGTSVIVDEPVATVLGAGGEISVALVPGDYRARVALSDADRWIAVGIPDGAGGYDIEDGIEVAAGPIPSASVAQAQTARDEAEAAQALAEAAQALAEAAYDDFDDRYLGAKASDPALDNDGDALTTGALYFNTTSGKMMVWGGAAWTNVQYTGAEIAALYEAETDRNAYTDAEKTKLDGVAFAVDTFSGLATVTASQVAVGDYVRVIDINAVYQRAADVATDHHLTTPGGVKLYDLQGRNAQAAAMAASLPDGSIVLLAGLPYEVDSSATGSASATNDLGVNGLVPFGVEQPGHYGGIAAMAASSRTESYIPPGTYVLGTGLDLSNKRSVSLAGDVVLDFTGITDAANVPGRGYLNLDGGDLVALPNLASDTTVGATSITLASAPSGLAEGDWICIYDPTNFSFSGFKSSYRDGQWCKVAGISGSTITLYTTILRAYAAATVEVYKHPGTTFKIDGPGNIVIKESLVNDVNLNAKAGFCAARYVDVDFSKVRSTQSDYGSMLLRQCLEVHGAGYKTQQFSERTAGLNYGVVAVGCQHVDIQGDFYGYNHSFTVGGGDGPGFVPTRYVKVSGTFNAHPTTTIGAANFHGHCEYIHYDGFFDGAVTGGGDYIKVSGVIRGRGNQSCFYMNEMRGANVDLSGVRIETQGNPHLNTGGVIDIGANAINQLNADTVNGGTIDMRGVTIYAPNSQRGMVIRNRGCVQGVALDVTGMKCTLASGGIHYIDAISGSNFTALYMRDASLGTTALNYLRNIDKFYGWEIIGEIELTTLTSQPNRSASVSYQAPWNLVPNIITALNGDRIVGGKPVVHGAESRTNTSAFIFLNSADNANFTSSEACKIAYRITV